MTILANNPSTGLGALSAVPAGSTNGTVLGMFPAGGVGARFYLPSGSSISFTVAPAQPSSVPSAVFTISQVETGPNWDETLSSGQMIYITASSGNPLFRWF